MTSTALDAYGSKACWFVVVMEDGRESDKWIWFGVKRFAAKS